MHLDTLAQRRRIKDTISRCPSCLAAIPATIYEEESRIRMAKVCPDHGRFDVELARDPKWYFESHGSPSNACCGAGQAAADAADCAHPFESLSTCIALIEIVDDCNLACPACYASSPLPAGSDLDCTPFERFTQRVQGVIDRKGSIDILQLSGGEPTIHPEFTRLLRWALEQPKIGYVLINTNAVRLANEAEFRRELGSLRRQLGRFELYVQFDGPQEAGQRELRGADLRGVRERAIDACGELGIPTTLAMVVVPATLPHLGDTLRWGLTRPHVRGISFQPLFRSGRVPAIESRLPMAPQSREAISVGDVVGAVVAQSRGVLVPEDFTPLPCGDPNCHTIGYLLRTDDGPVGMSRLVELPALQGFLQNRVNYSLADLARCGCETEPLGSILKDLEIGPDRPFRLFIKPFMDAWTFDQDRIDRCCTHVIRQDGSLDSFCRYYLNGGAAGEARGVQSGGAAGGAHAAQRGGAVGDGRGA